MHPVLTDTDDNICRNISLKGTRWDHENMNIITGVPYKRIY